MIIAILQHTPLWVWALLIALTALGLAQTRDRELSITRVTVLPLALAALSLAGVLTAFGAAPLALGSWAVGLLAVLVGARDILAVHGARASASAGSLHVPGSWLPLALILSLFAVKYAVGVGIALNPSLAADTEFAGGCSALYGLFSGIFLARAWSLRRLTARVATLQTA